MTVVKREVTLTTQGSNFLDGVARILTIVEKHGITNPSIGMMPIGFDPCPEHFDDECAYSVQVNGIVWDKTPDVPSSD